MQQFHKEQVLINQCVEKITKLQLRYRFPGQFWEVIRKVQVGYKYDLFGYFSRMDFTRNCR